ncbi:MAG: 4Fe-4S binding protein [Clostridia bacterium]|nr:4Fe-4S binding protein [Clostridia bacterium]
MVEKEKCIGCGACASMCQFGAIVLVDGKAKIDISKCKRCGTCQNFCPMEAIDLSREED